MMAMASQQMEVYTADGSQSSELVPIMVPCTLAVDSRTSMVEVVGILPAMTMNSWHGRDTKNGIDSKGGSSNNTAGDSWQGWDDGKLDDHHNIHFGSSHVSKADSDDRNNFSWDSGESGESGMGCNPLAYTCNGHIAPVAANSCILNRMVFPQGYIKITEQFSVNTKNLFK